MSVGNIDVASGGISIGGTNATYVNIGKSSSTVAIQNTASVSGLLTAIGNIASNLLDSITGVTLNIGTSLATLVQIGKSGLNTAILGTASVAGALTATTSLLTPLIDTVGNVAMEIGKNNATTITIGRAAQNVAIANTASVSGALTATTSLLTPLVNSLLATNDLAIASTQTSGVLNIGTSSSRTSTGVINIGSSTNAGAINILTASTLNSDGTPAISIGTNTGAKLIKIGNNNSNNTVNLARLQVAGQDIQPIDTTGGTITLGYNQTVGPLYIGGGNSRTATASININTGGTCSSVVNINTGTGASQSSTTNIGTGSTTGTVTIGNTNNTTAIASPLTYASTITPTYSTLPSFTPSMIGYIINGTALTPTIVSGSQLQANSLTVTVGIWIISYDLALTSTGVNSITQSSCGIGTINTAGANALLYAINVNSATQSVTGSNIYISPSYTGSFTYSASASQIFYLNFLYVYSGAGVLSFRINRMSAIRIA